MIIVKRWVKYPKRLVITENNLFIGMYLRLQIEGGKRFSYYKRQKGIFYSRTKSDSLEKEQKNHFICQINEELAYSQTFVATSFHCPLFHLMVDKTPTTAFVRPFTVCSGLFIYFYTPD